MKISANQRLRELEKKLVEMATMHNGLVRAHEALYLLVQGIMMHGLPPKTLPAAEEAPKHVIIP